MSKQSSIDWFHREILKLNVRMENKELMIGEFVVKYGYLLAKAREMHRQEIVDAWLDGVGNWDNEKQPDDYYNKTFGGSNES